MVMPPARRGFRAAAVAVALGTTVIVPAAWAAPAQAASDCGALDDAVYEVVKPSNDAALLSPWSNETTKAAARGFTQDEGTLFQASRSASGDLVAVHRLYSKANNDFWFTASAADLAGADDQGYEDQGVRFYVADEDNSCTVGVYAYHKGTKHRLALTGTDRSALAADGWSSDGRVFYAAPGDTTAPDPEPTPTPTPTPTPPGTGTGTGSFSFAVIPDSQMEVTKAGDPRMTNRTTWLAKQPGLAFVDHTGDVVNWDTDDHAQMKVAKAAFDVLHDAGIPYSLSIGNHDTEATGVGGTARDPSNTYKLQKDTSTFNAYFDAADYTDVGGAYEKNKVDNTYSLYSAGGLKWMILNLEFCARPGVVSWAKQVVADHPDYNVIVSTHSYLDGSGNLDASAQGYGDTSGQKLFDQLVSQYPNIKMVFSGHVGYAAKARVDTGKDGNKVYEFLTTMHDPKTNPVRMLKVDPTNDSVTTSIYAPYTDQTFSDYSETITGMNFIH